MRNNLFVNLYEQSCNEFNTAIVDGNFPASGSYIDTTEHPEFAFKIKVGTLTSELTAQVLQDTSATATASIKNVTGAVVTITATDDNDQFIIEVESAKLDIANEFRYVTLALSGAAGGDDYLNIEYRGNCPRHRPVTQPANYIGNNVQVAG